MTDERREYVVMVAGLPHTFLLTEAEADARDGVPVKAVPAPQNKARPARNKKP